MEVTKLDFPSLNNFSRRLISGIFEGNGAAIEASSSDNDTPISAFLNAQQSFAPSLHLYF